METQRLSPLSKRVVRYKQQWFTLNSNPDGASCFHSGAMECNEGGGEHSEVQLDGTWMEVWYFCKARNDWARVPLGFVATAEENGLAPL